LKKNPVTKWNTYKILFTLEKKKSPATTFSCYYNTKKMKKKLFLTRCDNWWK